MRLTFRTALACLALACLCGFSVPAQAQAVFNLGTFIVDNDADTGDIAISIPAGNYNSYTFTTDWSVDSGDPWSNEAIWAMTDGPLADPATIFYADQGAAPNSAGDGNPVTLMWDNYLGIPFSGPLDGFVLTLQTFGPATAQWANTVLELSYETPPVAPAVDVDLGAIANAYTPININTFGADFDTELGVYSSTGIPFAINDDAVGLQSEIDLLGGLPAGDYIAVLGGYNTIYGDGFVVTPGSSAGNYGLSVGGIPVDGVLADGQLVYVGFSVVPEPASLLLLGLALVGGLFVRRRTA